MAVIPVGVENIVLIRQVTKNPFISNAPKNKTSKSVRTYETKLTHPVSQKMFHIFMLFCAAVNSKVLLKCFVVRLIGHSALCKILQMQYSLV